MNTKIRTIQPIQRIAELEEGLRIANALFRAREAANDELVEQLNERIKQIELEKGSTIFSLQQRLLQVSLILTDQIDIIREESDRYKMSAMVFKVAASELQKAIGIISGQ